MGAIRSQGGVPSKKPAAKRVTRTPAKRAGAASRQTRSAEKPAPAHAPSNGSQTGIDPGALIAGLSGQLAEWQKLMSAMPSLQTRMPGLAETFKDWQPAAGAIASNLRIEPDALLGLQRQYTTAVTELLTAMLAARPIAPSQDKRFSTPAWQGSHAYLAELYLVNARFMQELAEHLDADAKTKAKIRFAVSQWVDAMSPSNYLATNPEAQQKLLATRGQSLATGLTNMLADIEKGRISQTDESVFKVGRNLATTPGDVVFQNQIFQLIQYRPATPKVFEKPLLMVPPCINKYYILDLQPENSLVAHSVAAGHTVFMVSWKNPDQDDAALTWDDYIEDGVIKAIRVVQDISDQKKINLLGFCVGGTMLATALAVLAARKHDVAKSLTLLTTLLDFTDTGMLDVFVDEQAVQTRERTIGGIHGGPVGLMPARDLATSFSFLRPNDLVWNYVVNNYLKGESPPPFDLLYWNGDSTNLPGPFFAWYLRNTYLENRLKDPNGVMTCGVPVDLRRITAPTYLYGSREDHIVPWTTAYRGSRLLGGPLRFVLGASGHIAGVINPPAKKKRSYWTGAAPAGREALDAEHWLDGASESAGSWWQDWTEWLNQHAGKQIKAAKRPGHGRYQPIEDAPGSYVLRRAT
jgi:polyhydroxyalkanoate synthase